MKNHEPARAGSMTVTFWGTRGTRMVAGRGFSRHGRNTICVEVNCSGRILVFDAGSGLTALGTDLIARDIRQIDLFLTHAHYDHVEGIPFFDPFYQRNFTTRFWGGRLKGVGNTREIVDRLMIEPFFPISQEKFQATISYRDIADFEKIELGDGISVRTTRLHHPGGATGYRVSHAGKSFAFITDTSHAADQRDVALVDFLKGADLFAYDCSYLDSEFERFASYGHSTWEEGIRLKKASRAKAMAGFHHMPFRTDEAIDAIVSDVAGGEEGIFAAHDGMRIEI